MASNSFIFLISTILLTILQSTSSAYSPSVPSTYYGKQLQEAEIIALETSGFIVPVTPLVNKIMRDLKAIRSQYKEVADVTINRKWVPGEVFVSGSITDAQLDQVDKSVYGPLQDVKKYNYGSVLVFTKPYHPEVLSERLAKKFGIVRAAPNTSVGPMVGNGVITYKQKDNMYTIEKGPVRQSYPGLNNKFIYEFQVKSDGHVNLRSSTAPFQRV